MADSTIPQLQEAAAEDVNDDFVFPVDSGTETYKLKFENLMAYLIANFPADWVTEAMVKANAITSAKIANGAVTTAKIGDSQVTTAKIANGAVTTAKIGDSQVTGAKIASNTITAGNIAANAIGQSELANNAVVDANVASNAAIAGTKINPNFGTQEVRSLGRFGTGFTTAGVNSSTPSGTLFTLGNGQMYLCVAKYRSGSNTGARAVCTISSHSSTGNVYVTHADTAVLLFENHTGMSIRLTSSSANTTTATITWIRLF